MIKNLDEVTESELRFDVCVVGAGAVGIAIAREFLGEQVTVALLEGGDNGLEPWAQDTYRSEMLGQPHLGTHEGRARALGGTTKLWAGQALPMFEIDFESREWVPFSGWPISLTTLNPYYRRAEDVMQVPHSTYDTDSWPSPVKPFSEEKSSVRFCYSQFAPEPDFSRKYKPELLASNNVTVLLHANAVELNVNSNATEVTSVSIKSYKGTCARVFARVFVVCCGGIDNARLLLASGSTEPNGVGNRFGNVGRYFQDHPTVRIPFTPLNPRMFDSRFSAIRTRSSINMVKLYSSKEFQKQHRILNVGAEVVHEDSEDAPLAALTRLTNAARKRTFNRQTLGDCILVSQSPFSVLVAVARKMLGRRARSANHIKYKLLLSCEQEPSPTSQITLSTKLDNVGMPRSCVNWQISETVSRSIKVFLNEIAEVWKNDAIAEFDLDSVQLDGRESGSGGGYSDFNHHIGTTRMGLDPRTSVVDANCCVHGYGNLYMAGSSIFPTGSFSNPTLTALALSYRLSDYLKLKLQIASL